MRKICRFDWDDSERESELTSQQDGGGESLEADTISRRNGKTSI